MGFIPLPKSMLCNKIVYSLVCFKHTLILVSGIPINCVSQGHAADCETCCGKQQVLHNESVGAFSVFFLQGSHAADPAIRRFIVRK